MSRAPHTHRPTTARKRTSRSARRLLLVSAIATVASMALPAGAADAAAPTPGQTQPPGTEGLSTMLGWGGWLVSFVCVAGILIVAAMMALKHRRGEGGGEAMGALGWVLGACVLGSAAGPIAGALI